MAIFVGGNQVNKIFVGTQQVQRVYVGTQLVYPVTQTGNWVVGTYTTSFGGGNYQVEKVVTVTEKNSSAGTMKVKVETAIKSNGNWTISSSQTKNGTTTVDGQATNYTYNCSLTAGQRKSLNTTTYTISNAFGKTIAVNALLNFQVTITGVGTVNTVTSNHNVKLPSS